MIELGPIVVRSYADPGCGVEWSWYLSGIPYSNRGFKSADAALAHAFYRHPSFAALIYPRRVLQAPPVPR